MRSGGFEAEGFYLAMGARRLGDVASPGRPSRTLPIPHLHLSVAGRR